MSLNGVPYRRIAPTKATCNSVVACPVFFLGVDFAAFTTIVACRVFLTCNYGIACRVFLDVDFAASSCFSLHTIVVLVFLDVDFVDIITDM